MKCRKSVSLRKELSIEPITDPKILASVKSTRLETVKESAEEVRSLSISSTASISAARVKQIKEAIEDDDLPSLLELRLTNVEFNQVRFAHNMNILQLVSHEQAKTIFKYLLTRLDTDSLQRQARHRDSNLGALAVHLAAPTGDQFFIKKLFEWQEELAPRTLSNLSLFHCAAQGYYGIANIFLFNR